MHTLLVGKLSVEQFVAGACLGEMPSAEGGHQERKQRQKNPVCGFSVHQSLNVAALLIIVRAWANMATAATSFSRSRGYEFSYRW